MTDESSLGAISRQSSQRPVLDIEAIRAELGLTKNIVTVNAGSTGPVSNASILAAQAAFERGRSMGFPGGSGYMNDYEELGAQDRSEVATLLGCVPNQVALCESTTTGMNILLWGAELAVGDEVLTTSLENPAAVVPLRQLVTRRGAHLVVIEVGVGEVDVASAVAEKITPRTRVLLISDVNFVSGARVDLKEITRIAHERGVLVFADGVQAAGTCAIDVQDSGVDGYAIARHKFLCGPGGAGALYVSPTALERVHPTFSGVFSDASHGHGRELSPFAGARRFEVSTRSLPVTAGAVAAMRWLRTTLGWEAVQARTHSLGNELLRRLAHVDGVRVLTPTDSPGALISFVALRRNQERVMEYLARQGIAARLVPDPGHTHNDASEAIRLSMGVWNREGDPELIATTVQHALKATRAESV